MFGLHSKKKLKLIRKAVQAKTKLISTDHCVRATTGKDVPQNVLKDIVHLREKRVSIKAGKDALNDHQFSPDTGEMTPVCTRIVLAWLYLVSIGRADLLWTVYLLAHSVKKWNTACGNKCFFQPH